MPQTDSPRLVVATSNKGKLREIRELLEPTGWTALSLADASAGRFDGPPRAIALGFEIAAGKLTGPRDLFDHPSFDRAREQANLIADVLRQQGTFEPHRLPLDESEQQQLPAVATRTESRWVDAS